MDAPSAYLLGLITVPALAGLLTLIYVLCLVLSEHGWVARFSIHDDSANQRWFSDARRTSLGPIHWGRRIWWVRRSEGIKRVAWWVGVGRVGGRGLYVGKGRRL